MSLPTFEEYLNEKVYKGLKADLTKETPKSYRIDFKDPFGNDKFLSVEYKDGEVVVNSKHALSNYSVYIKDITKIKDPRGSKEGSVAVRKILVDAFNKAEDEEHFKVLVRKEMKI